jgi:hypothetical protein
MGNTYVLRYDILEEYVIAGRKDSRPTDHA